MSFAFEQSDEIRYLRAQIEGLKAAVALLERRAAFGNQCWQDQCENAYVEQSVVKRLREDNGRLAAAVRNQSGDNLCHLSNPETDPIPPAAEFLESCRRFHAQRSGLTGELAGCMTIAQLEAESQRLRDILAGRPVTESHLERVCEALEMALRLLEMDGSRHELWHTLLDEARALQGMASAVRTGSGVRDERESCAKIADAHDNCIEFEHGSRRGCPNQVAKEIRERDQ